MCIITLCLSLASCAPPKSVELRGDRHLFPLAAGELLTVDRLFKREESKRLVAPCEPTASTPPTVRTYCLGESADEIAGLEVVIQSPQRDAIEIVWRSPDGSICEACRAVPSRVERRDDGSTLAYFELLLQPAWHATVKIVELVTPLIADGSRVDVRPVVAGGVDKELVARSRVAPIRLDLGNDVREAIAVSAGDNLEIDLPVAAGTLALSAAVARSAGGVLEFRIVAIGTDEVESILQSREIQAEGAWHDLEVKLPRRGAARLRLEVRGGDARGDLGLWAGLRYAGRSSNDRPNVLLVSIDTLRADRLSMAGYDRDTTPRLDEWTRRHGTFFERVVAPAPWTLPSHVSMLSGQDAVAHGTNFDDAIPTRVKMLAEQLRGEGYYSLAVTGGGFVHPRYGFDRGFDSYMYFSSAGFAFDEELERNAERLAAQLSRAVDAPFFAFFHTYEMHNPYSRREPWATEYSRHPAPAAVSTLRLDRLAFDGFTHRMGLAARGVETPLDDAATAQFASDLYDAQLAYLDGVITNLLERVAAATPGRRTLVVVTSDHGELFGEHGHTNHGSLYEGVLRIPLVVGVVPSEPAWVKRVRPQVRLIDVAPTILDFAGIEPDARIEGRSLRPLLIGRNAGSRAAVSLAASSNFGIALTAANGFKSIFRDPAFDLELSRAECFDVASDPREMLNLCPGSAVPKGLIGELERRADLANGAILVVESAERVLRVRLRGARLRTQHFKFVREACAGGRWTDQELELRLVPGSRCEILVYSHGPEGLEIGLPSDGAAGGATRWMVLRADGGSSVRGGWRLEDGRWQPLSHARSKDREGASVEWIRLGTEALADSLPASEDARLVEQLRALGYLD